MTLTSRLFLRVFYVAYAIGIVALLVIPMSWMPAFYHPVFMAGISSLALTVVMLPGFFTRHLQQQHQSMVERYQASLAFCAGVNGLGGLGLYKLYEYGIQYDKILHFLVSVIFVLGIAHFLHYFHARSRTIAIILAVIIVILCGFAWEGWEVLQDHLFGTQTSGVYGADYFSDTFFDLLFDIFGSIVGGILLYIDSSRSTRRIKFLPFSLSEF
ncbi:MAG: hypothetical protein NT003_00855 [Candidatus Magasanikbacteria bacterium]|nr:hypothetical protein [Candidatus Magasanikbacteria bacterium]